MFVGKLKKAAAVLLLTTSTVTALLLGELFLRLFFPVNSPRLISASGHDGWILWNAHGEALGLIPNFRGRLISSEFDISIRLNEFGFRDQAFAEKKTHPATCICVLGDSFTFGYGVEADETYGQLLKKILKTNGYDVEVYNLGVPGTATAFQYQLLQNFSYLRPNIVILGMLATYADKTGNDLIDNLAFVQKDAIPTQPERAFEPARFPTNPKGLLSRESPQVDKARESIHLSQQLFHYFRSTRRWLLQRSHFYRRFELMIGQEFPPWVGHWQAEASRQRIEQGWLITQKWLLRFQELARQQQFALILLHIPFPDFRSDENAKIDRFVASFAKANNLLFVDGLLPAMTSSRLQPRDFYFLLDGHWRASAHKLCAEVLSEFLMTQNLLATSPHD